MQNQISNIKSAVSLACTWIFGFIGAFTHIEQGLKLMALILSVLSGFYALIKLRHDAKLSQLKHERFEILEELEKDYKKHSSGDLKTRNSDNQN